MGSSPLRSQTVSSYCDAVNSVFEGFPPTGSVSGAYLIHLPLSQLFSDPEASHLCQPNPQPHTSYPRATSELVSSASVGSRPSGWAQLGSCCPQLSLCPANSAALANSFLQELYPWGYLGTDRCWASFVVYPPSCSPSTPSG